VVKWQFIIVTGILIAAVIAAGCTDEEVPAPLDSLSGDPVLPGQVLMATGDVTGDGIAGGTIDTITFAIGLVPGNRPVDIEKVSIVYADTIKTETLIPVEGYRGDPPQGSWGILEVINQVGDTNNQLEDKEQFVIRINPRSYLPSKRMAIIVIRPAMGTTPLTLRRFAPSEIFAQGNILSPL
jgi:hypothetical protein